MHYLFLQNSVKKSLPLDTLLMNSNSKKVRKQNQYGRKATSEIKVHTQLFFRRRWRHKHVILPGLVFDSCWCRCIVESWNKRSLGKDQRSYRFQAARHSSLPEPGMRVAVVVDTTGRTRECIGF